MVWAHRFWLRLQTLLRRDRITQRLDDEIQFHLDHQIAENISAGMRPDEARYAAQRTFGNPTFLKEKARDTWGWRWLEQFTQDVRFGARLLLHSPLFTAVVVLSLALGIGSNAAIFSIVDALMLRQLPVTAPDQLVLLSQRTAQEADYAWSYPLYEQFRDHVDALAGVLCIAGGGKTRATFHSVVSDSQPELVERQDVSGGNWSVLGVRAAVGRMFTQEDDQLDNPHDVAVISYAFWKNRFDLDPQVIGRTFILYNTPFTIIGVAPLQFRGTRPDEQPQIWVPVTTRKHLRPGFRAFTEHGSSWLTVIARLRPTATSAQVRAQLDTLFQVDHHEQLRRWGSQLTPQHLAEEQTRHVEVESGANGFSWNRDRYSRSLYVLLTIGGLVLLIACVNVATLLLARAAEGNCRPDIDRCGALAPLPPTAHGERTVIRRCGRVERRGCDLGQPHAGGIRFGRRTSEAEPCARLAHVRVCDRACYRHGHIVRRRSGAAFDAHGYEPSVEAGPQRDTRCRQAGASTGQEPDRRASRAGAVAGHNCRAVHPHSGQAAQHGHRLRSRPCTALLARPRPKL